MSSGRESHREIRAISFDGDMTLWDFEQVMRQALGVALEDLRRQVRSPGAEDLTVEEMIRIREEVAGELEGTTANLERLRLRAFQRTLERIGCPDAALAARPNALYLEHRFEGVEPYPDVVPCLEALHSSYVLGLLSNGNGYPERCGLAGWLQFVIFSQDVGAEKPADIMFRTACERAGCRPEELLHVGDSLHSDVAGANAVGAVSVWLNRERVENETGIVPDVEVASLTEIPGIVGA